MNEPEYYIKNGLSPLQAMEQGLLSVEEYRGFLKGNIIKYITRAGYKEKNGLEDIVKAMDYLQHLYSSLEDEHGKNEQLRKKIWELWSNMERYKAEL